jgi:hypothetical protein
MAARVRVVIAGPLQAELVEPMRAVDPRVEVEYEPDLLPAPRYPNDHAGAADFHRAPDDERRWWKMIGAAEVLFGIPGDSGDGLAEAVRVAPGLRWVQATSAGAGEQVGAAGLTAETLERVTVTSAAGIHAGPLAELSGATLLIVGLGQIGAEVARLAAAFGMRVIGLNRRARARIRTWTWWPGSTRCTSGSRRRTRS